MVEFAPPDCYSDDNAVRSACRSACTLATCPLETSDWEYRPSLAANGLFLALFAMSMIAFVAQGAIARKRFLGFSIAMVLGSLLEIMGYAGRIWANLSPWTEDPFLLQIVALTIAPAFYAAGIYLCLARIVTTVGVENSRLQPKWYPRIFIGCDFISLVLQAVGGAMASISASNGNNPINGNNIMIAGLSFQVFTLLVFIVLSADFAWRTYRRTKAMGEEKALESKHALLKESWKFKAFLWALIFATLCVFTRSVFRVAELSGGWSGYLMRTERYFIALEGAVLVVGILALNVFHPAFCFREGFE